MNIIRSTSGDPHTIIVKLSNVPDLFRVFILFITLPAKIRPTLDSHDLMSRSRIAVIDSHTFTIIGKILPTMLFKRSAVIRLPTKLVECRISMSVTITVSDSPLTSNQN